MNSVSRSFEGLPCRNSFTNHGIEGKNPIRRGAPAHGQDTVPQPRCEGAGETHDSQGLKFSKFPIVLSEPKGSSASDVAPLLPPYLPSICSPDSLGSTSHHPTLCASSTSTTSLTLFKAVATKTSSAAVLGELVGGPSPVQLPLNEPHTLKAFLPLAKPGASPAALEPISDLPTIVLIPPSWELASDISYATGSRPHPLPCQISPPHTLCFRSIPAPSFVAGVSGFDSPDYLLR